MYTDIMEKVEFLLIIVRISRTKDLNSSKDKVLFTGVLLHTDGIGYIVNSEQRACLSMLR